MIPGEGVRRSDENQHYFPTFGVSVSVRGTVAHERKIPLRKLPAPPTVGRRSESSLSETVLHSLSGTEQR
jgi:hypothetical protein